MKYLRILPLLFITALSFATEAAQAADEDLFLGQIQPPSEQTMGQGQSALWTLPNVATQYQPSQPTPAMQAALQAQQEGRFLDALIRLDEASKNGLANEDAEAEINLLRASFLLQGKQSQQALETLAPLIAKTQHVADAWALTAMAQLQQGQMQKALKAAQHAHDLGDGMLPPLALSYALQGAGRLTEARAAMHGFNSRANIPAPQLAITLAREAELALTLDQVQSASTLADQAREVDATQPYVIAVSGLTFLIDGQAGAAKAAFETALRRDPKDARALLGLGLAEIKLGNFESGQKKLQAANEADPGNALILTYLGRSQQQLGQTGAAMASWRSAQQADPKDPAPWLYQAQAELQANRPQDARESLREAQARTKNRSVYRGERLLHEDEQLLQANLAEAQRRLGLDRLAFQTLSDSPGEKNSSALRNQADALQGQRFGESARRGLLLQSLFDAKPGDLPAELDIYGDGAGLTGGATPQHGEISGLSAQQASYNNYDNLFSPSATLAADATVGSQNTSGEQVRLATVGAGSDTLGLGIAMREYKTDGFGPFNNLDNRIWQGTVQWRPSDSSQLFVSRQAFNSLHGETRYPADPLWNGEYHQIQDNSDVTRLGLRHSLTDDSELRGVVGRQQTDQTDNINWIANTLPYSKMPPFFGPTLPFPQRTDHDSSIAHAAELQYRRSGAGHATQWGMSAARSTLDTQWGRETIIAQQLYADWQQALNPYWQLETGLAWGKSYVTYSGSNPHMRRWLPKLGLVYTPDNATHVRIAAWKSLDNAAVGDASLAPASLAGIALNRPGESRKLARSVALGADKQLDAAWLLEGQAQRRWIDDPADDGSGGVNMQLRRVDLSRLALHWQPGPVGVTLAYDDERFWDDATYTLSDSLAKQHLRSEQLGLRWLANEQWTANLSLSHNQVSAQQQSTAFTFDAQLNPIPDPILLDVRDRFNQADASLNWQFNRRGSVEMSVRNLGGNSSRYTEIDPLVPRFSKGRMSYVKLKLIW